MYRAHHAEHAARLRACKPRKRRIAVDGVLAETVHGLLAKRWSPEQVAHELRVLFAGQPLRWLCKESIYQAIYDAAVAITRPARRRRRRRRLFGLQRRGRLTAMRMIDERPAEVKDRLRAGHWEGDLIMGAGNRSAIGTLVERSTRFLIVLAFTDAVASTEAVRHAITAALAQLPAGLQRTLSWDQGKELALHPQITAATGTDVFFCDAHSPWQRASNENMNGLLRDYFLERHRPERPRDRGRREDRRGSQRPATQDARLAAPSGVVRRRDRGRITEGPPEPRTRGDRLRLGPRASPPSNPTRVSCPAGALRSSPEQPPQSTVIQDEAPPPAPHAVGQPHRADTRRNYHHTVHLLRR
jgi:IS30 family transposase